MTICYECKHFRNLEPGSCRADVWYNHVCTAVTRDKALDPVTGKMMYVCKNDLGCEVLTDEQHPYCRDTNKGDCPMFEKA